MVEAFLAAIVGAGLSEDDFWNSTPYLTDLRLEAVGKVRRESALLTGWMAERFAREERLQGPQTYIRQFFQGQDHADSDAPDPVMFHRMAQDWGLEIEPYSE